MPQSDRSAAERLGLRDGLDQLIAVIGNGCMENPVSGPAVSGVVVTTAQVPRLAVAAYLARFKGQSRIHTESDFKSYLDWCAARDLDPLGATRPHIELYLRWLQEVRRYRPSTVSRRMSVSPASTAHA